MEPTDGDTETWVKIDIDKRKEQGLKEKEIQDQKIERGEVE